MNSTASIIETEPGQFSLLLKAGTTVDNAIETLGHQPTGYFWERVAKFLVRTEAPHLEGRVDYDCESSMFCAHGNDRNALVQLQDLLNSVVTNKERIGLVVAAARKRRFPLHDLP